jgi:hypothetical protein
MRAIVARVQAASRVGIWEKHYVCAHIVGINFMSIAGYLSKDLSHELELPLPIEEVRSELAPRVADGIKGLNRFGFQYHLSGSEQSGAYDLRLSQSLITPGPARWAQHYRVTLEPRDGSTMVVIKMKWRSIVSAFVRTMLTFGIAGLLSWLMIKATMAASAFAQPVFWSLQVVHLCLMLIVPFYQIHQGTTFVGRTLRATLLR